jgi:hypothetical protein
LPLIFNKFVDLNFQMTQLPNPIGSVSTVQTTHPQIIPPIVAWLGYGGLLPFVSLAAATWFDTSHSSLWRDALVSYGAVILSFVGALHWGFAMSQSDMTPNQRTNSFVWSVVPSLLAWVALLMTPKYAAMLLVAGFLAHFWQDRRLVKLVNLPVWYLPLRLKLTLVAVISLISSYFS